MKKLKGINIGSLGAVAFLLMMAFTFLGSRVVGGNIV